MTHQSVAGSFSMMPVCADIPSSLVSLDSIRRSAGVGAGSLENKLRKCWRCKSVSKMTLCQKCYNMLEKMRHDTFVALDVVRWKLVEKKYTISLSTEEHEYLAHISGWCWKNRRYRGVASKA